MNKGQPINSIVKTCDGDILISDLRVGDKVFSSDGLEHKIKTIHTNKGSEVFTITLRDGCKFLCGSGSEITVETSKTRVKGNKVRRTSRSIYDTGSKYKCGTYKYYMKMSDPVQYRERELPFDPYSLGAILGDGSITGNGVLLSYHEQDFFIINKVLKNLSKKYGDITIKPRRTSGKGMQTRLMVPSCRRSPIKIGLEEINVYNNKHIPKDYQISSIEDRINIVRGLMDTDGSCRKNRSSFSNNNKNIVMPFMDILRSLGQVCVENKMDTRRGMNCYSINVKSNICPFSLRRKSEEWSVSWKNPPSRAIINIELMEEKQDLISIVTDADDGSYLTNDFIVMTN